MNTINFNLRGERVAEDVYRDSAIINGYEATIKEATTYTKEGLTQKEADNFVFPKGKMIGSKKISDGENTFRFIYNMEIEVVNTETEIEFGKAIEDKEFRIRDSKLAGEATRIRAEQAYGI